MIGITGDKPGEFRVYTGMTQEDVTADEAVVVEGSANAVEFLDSLARMSTDAAERLEGVLATIYEMGYERGKAEGAKAPETKPTPPAQTQGPRLRMRA